MTAWQGRLATCAAVAAGLWAGILLSIAALATPAAFAMLTLPDAGRFVGRLFAQEAYLSIALAIVLLVIERQRSGRAAVAGVGSVFSTNLILLLGTLFCTVAGYFGVQPMMAEARAGQGAFSFGALHAISTAFFALKGVLVMLLAWRLTAYREDRVKAAATTS